MTENFQSSKKNSDEEISVQDMKKELELHKRALINIFTPGQIKKLLNPELRPTWSFTDISNAISIYSSGPRAYRQLLKKKYPLPAISTLKAWTKKIKIKPGILKQVIKIIKSKDLSQSDKICVLSFDEMKLRYIYSYDKVNDEVLKPCNYVQVVMMRGLVNNWKQPVFFDYDCSISKDLLFEIIKFIEDAGFYVAAIVSDLGGGNRGLHRDLKINHEQPYFQINSESHRIYTLADVPHLLKLIRNNFLDHGLILEENKEINKNIVSKVLTQTGSSDLRITHKITTEHLTVHGPQRQKVKTAAKLFSHTISQAIYRCGSLGLFTENENWLECGKFFKLVTAVTDTQKNDLIDFYCR